MKKRLFPALLAAFSSLSAQPIFESNLPIIVLETPSSTIPNEPKTPGSMRIFHRLDGQKNALADQPLEYDGPIGIEVRGASSSGYPQQPYGIETRSADGSEQNVSLFGMPAEHDWALLSHFNDKAFCRNSLAFQLFRDMGRWAPRTQLAEVFWNGDYRGVYLFTEKIKRDSARVDVQKCDSTGGYILKIDYSTPDDSWPSAFGDPAHPDREVRFVHVYPKAENLTFSQENYIKNRLFETEKALYGPAFRDSATGWRAFFEPSSFVDYWLVSEVSRNNDGSKKSRFFYKNRDETDGGRFRAGPVWDFDWAWKNIDECSVFAATDGSGWSWAINDCQPDVAGPGWYAQMLQDTFFANAVRCRYLDLRQNVLKTSRLTAFVDSTAALVAEAQARHYARWPTLDYNAGAPEVNFEPTTFDGEIQKMKSWIETRMAWLDANIPGHCPSEPLPAPPERPDAPLFFYPNPASAEFFLETSLPWNGKVRCSDALGRLTSLPFEIEKARVRVDLRSLAGGVYFFWTEDARGETLRTAGRAVVVR